MDKTVRCAKCGQIVPAERVAAVPGVQLCVPCQSGVEHAPPPPPANFSGEFCPWCKKRGIESPLVWRRPRDPTVMGEFLSCSRYPACSYSDRGSMRNLGFSDHDKASPAQVALLVKHGMSESEAKALSAKEAHKRIDRLKGIKPRESSPPSATNRQGKPYELAGHNPIKASGENPESSMAGPAEFQIVQHPLAMPDVEQSGESVDDASRPDMDEKLGEIDSPAQLSPTDRLGKIKANHPFAYQKWTPAEEQLLRVAFQEGKKIKEIAEILQRQSGGIRARLIKLGLIN